MCSNEENNYFTSGAEHIDDCDRDSRYNNLNLNQCRERLPTVASSKTITDRNLGNSMKNVTHFDEGFAKKRNISNATNGWKNSVIMNEAEEKNDSQKKQSKCNENNASTLSLYISSYENGVAVNCTGQIIHPKTTSAFEFQRQQNVINSSTELMQFSSSQILLNPNSSPPPPPPPPSSPISSLSEENFYNSLSDAQKIFFDEFKKKKDDTEPELELVKGQLESEKRWNADLLEDRVPLNILNDKHQIKHQRDAEELKTLKEKIAFLEKEFADYQLFSQKKISELNDEIAKLKREKAKNDIRSKYTLDYHISGFDDDFSDDSDVEAEKVDYSDSEYVEEPSPKRQRLDEKYPEVTWEKIIAEHDSGKSFKVLQHNHKKLKNLYEITRMKAYLKKKGSTHKKFFDLDTYVAEKN